MVLEICCHLYNIKRCLVVIVAYVYEGKHYPLVVFEESLWQMFLERRCFSGFITEQFLGR